MSVNTNNIALDEILETISELPSSKEEQEKVVDITENGTTVVTPDEGMTLSKVAVNVAIENGGGGTEEIENLIDESGVLDSTDGTATEKVEQLIEYANFKNIIQEALYKSEGSSSYYQMSIFRNTSIKDVSMFDFSKVKTFSGGAFMGSKIEELNIDVGNSSGSLKDFCHNCSNLKRVVITNMSSKHAGATSMFANCINLESVETLDLSNCSFSNTSSAQPFYECVLLEEVRFVEKCIKSNISFVWSPLLSAGSKQSIFDGLAAVETAQTLTLHANAKILQSQVDSANAKGWTVAGGTVVSEEEYYG